MRLRIVSDGTLKGTRVMSDRGEVLEGITSVEWRAGTGKPPSVTLVLEDVEVQLAGDEVPKQTLLVCPLCDVKCLIDTATVGRKADYEGNERQLKCLTCGKTSKGELWFDVSGMD